MNRLRTNLTSLQPEQLLERFMISAGELDDIRIFGRALIENMTAHVATFYQWIESQDDFAIYFSDPDKLARVRSAQVSYWKDFFAAEIDQNYIEKRQVVGEVHAHIGLPLQTYFSAMNVAVEIFFDPANNSELSAEERDKGILAVTRLIHLDTSIVVGALAHVINQRVIDQAKALMEMSTPVTSIWEDILMLPIVGVIDSRRASDIMTAMLSRIAESRARVFIMDISGVAVVDTAVANHLIKITKATRLMGCECIVSGLSPAIAQTIVELGIVVGEMKTAATLRDALELGFERTGFEMTRRP